MFAQNKPLGGSRVVVHAMEIIRRGDHSVEHVGNGALHRAVAVTKGDVTVGCRSRGTKSRTGAVLPKPTQGIYSVPCVYMRDGGSRENASYEMNHFLQGLLAFHLLLLKWGEVLVAGAGCACVSVEVSLLIMT